MTHYTQSREYHAWENMRQRCLNPRNPGWKRYGARGISIDPAWRTFDGFFADLGECPPGLTLERLDNSGNYTPDNVTWATMRQQQGNRRDNRNFSLQGKTLCLSAWCRELGISRGSASYALSKGQSFETVVQNLLSKLEKAPGRRPRALAGKVAP